MTPELKAAVERTEQYIAIYSRPENKLSDYLVALPVSHLRLILAALADFQSDNGDLKTWSAEASDEIERLTAALAEREWRPIETLDLPYDQRFDGWNRTMVDREIECWRSIDGRIRSYDVYGERQDVTDQITHWMPTPPLPNGPETQQPEPKAHLLDLKGAFAGYDDPISMFSPPPQEGGE